LKVYKVIPIPAHKEFFDDGSGRIKESIPITAMTLKRFGNDLVTGDQRGLIQYCDETFKYILVIKDAHAGAVRGLDFSPLDSKLASCSDDGKIHLWPVGRDQPERVLSGHQNDVKCLHWHPHRSLLATGSRDCTLKLWDPRQAACVSSVLGHKKQVNCCEWNNNGLWLASGSMDGSVKIYDLRVMREMEVWRGHNSEVCSLAWHPVHESLLLSGGYNGSLVYWLANSSQAPHSVIADAHRQSVDLIRWHPSGHLVASASHDCIVKACMPCSFLTLSHLPIPLLPLPGQFWSREPPGSALSAGQEAPLENPALFGFGPLPASDPTIIPSRSNMPPPAATGAGADASGGGRHQGEGGWQGGRGGGGGRGGDRTGNQRKRGRD